MAKPILTVCNFTLTLLVGLAVSLVLPCGALADLKPDQIALIVARGNRESLALANYYCKKRGVPTKHICQVDLTPGEVLDREQWRWSVRPEIQKWMTKNDPDGKLRCLVTTWGVPLKISPAKPDDASKAYLDHITRERADRLEKLETIAAELDKLAGGTPLGDAVAALPSGEQEQGDKAELDRIKQRLEGALKAAQGRIAAIAGSDRQQATSRLQQLATIAAGARVLLQGLNQQLQTMEAAGQETNKPREQFNLLRGRASAFSEIKLLLDQRPPGFDRDALSLTVLQQTGGLLATVEWLDEQIATARKNETGASFDSELSLVMWQDGYSLLRWQPNYLRPSFENSQLPKTFRTLMVSRLDAPTLKLAKGLIDTAMKVEAEGGLKGKVYLDARGLAQLEGPPLSPGSYPDYDRSLLITAAGLEALKTAEGEPRFEVTLNEQPELFQPGQCPDAALYCGWYSLAKYVDAFEWNPGAVAYHLASAEATTLKEIDSQAWCKKLLEDGVCATIGPVYEPYLIAFPRPNEFLASLVQADLPLVEVYARTKPFNSWMMVLIGDPLYRPFGEIKSR